MLNWMPWRQVGAGMVAIVTVVALAVAMSLLGSLYRGLTGPAAAGLMAMQQGAPDAPGAPQTSGTPSFAPSAIPELGDTWSTAFSPPPGPYSRLDGVAEIDGSLFALGRSDRNQPAIWVSLDGTSWTAAQLPTVTERLAGADGPSSELTATVVDVEESRGHLIALASVGLADIGGPIGTMLYVSEDDGQTWSEVAETPGMTAAALFDLAGRADDLIAVGTAIWASHDGGVSWIEVVDSSEVGGTLYAADASGGSIVAAGDGGDGDLLSPPAIALISADSGRTWERQVVDLDAGALSVAIGPAGQIVMGGYRDPDTPFWASDDSGRTWRAATLSGVCCAGDLVSTPEGYVAASLGSFSGTLVSVDGVTWTARGHQSGPKAISWGPVFGLVGATEDSILRGPASAP